MVDVAMAAHGLPADRRGEFALFTEGDHMLNEISLAVIDEHVKVGDRLRLGPRP